MLFLFNAMTVFMFTTEKQMRLNHITEKALIKKYLLTFDTSYKEDIERLKEHLIQTPVYQKILFDKYKNLYYRFFWNSQSLISRSGQYHGIFDRDLILMVFDENFKLITEKNIGNSYLWYYSFVSPKDCIYERLFLIRRLDKIKNMIISQYSPLIKGLALVFFKLQYGQSEKRKQFRNQ
jgi:hypothetical protein